MKLRIPLAVMVTAAERAPRLLTPNVYYGSQVIGVAVRLWPRRVPAQGHRMLSILWARPTAPRDYCHSCGRSVGHFTHCKSHDSNMERWREGDKFLVPIVAEEPDDRAEVEREYAVEFPGGYASISDDRGDVEDMVQWILDGRLVYREIRRGTWQAVPNE